MSNNRGMDKKHVVYIFNIYNGTSLRHNAISSSVGGKKVKSLSHVQLFATPWTVACQSPPRDYYTK